MENLKTLRMIRQRKHTKASRLHGYACQFCGSSVLYRGQALISLAASAASHSVIVFWALSLDVFLGPRSRAR